MIWPRDDQATREHFKTDLLDKHLLYDYDAENPETGAPEKWLYELWIRSDDRIVYSIHGGPMAGRLNYQKTDYQCIRPGELWQLNWLEETGTIVSLVWDMKNSKITTMLGFSIGHWSHAEEAHGDKRNPEDFKRWQGLAKLGIQTDRHILNDHAYIRQVTTGPGNLQDIDLNAPTM